MAKTRPTGIPRGSAVLLAIIAVLLAACTGPVRTPPVPTQTSTPAPAPRGEPAVGLGDPYFPSYGNPGYQVDHYHLRVRYDPASQQLAGEAIVNATATAPLSTVSFDFTGPQVDTVEVDGRPATAARDGAKLVITPEAGLADGAGFTVTVAYAGVPEPVTSPLLGSNGFHHTDDGAFVIGQPQSASTWFPVNDHPLDKATYTIELTVPDGVAAISNGVPDGRSQPEPGWTTWRWQERTPMASYLATLAIGDYRVREEQHRGRPMVTAVHASLPTEVDDQIRDTGQLADVLEQWFGPYPLDSYGGIVLADRRIRFALETQSRPIYGPGFFTGGRDGTGVIVHELAHQWAGNSVSVAGWSDIWLNEGFATYAEWLFSEWDGSDTAQETFDLYWDGPGAEDRFWSVPPGDPGAERLLHSAVYVRGAMTLHALRRTIGDQAFFEILRTWPAEQRDGNATTADLIALSERIAGQPLQSLFDSWLYGTVRPDYPG